MGDVMGDLSSPPRQDQGHGAARRRAGDQAPGAALGDVRLLDDAALDVAGRAVYSMQFAHYEEVPKSKAEEIIAKVRG
jgi:elongation factor G